MMGGLAATSTSDVVGCGWAERCKLLSERKLGREDLNLRPHRPEPSALTGRRYDTQYGL